MVRSALAQKFQNVIGAPCCIIYRKCVFVVTCVGPCTWTFQSYNVTWKCWSKVSCYRWFVLWLTACQIINRPRLLQESHFPGFFVFFLFWIVSFSLKVFVTLPSQFIWANSLITYMTFSMQGNDSCGLPHNCTKCRPSQLYQTGGQSKVLGAVGLSVRLYCVHCH